MTLRIELITAPATHDLRRRVLRQGTPTQDVTYAQDDLPGTVHSGAFDDSGTLVGVATWAPEAWPAEPGTRAVRLRGMAVEPSLQGAGVGAGLIVAGLELAWTLGAEVVWATARDAVLGFYERCGFTVVGEGFVDGPTALPHHAVIRRRPIEPLPAR